MGARAPDGATPTVKASTTVTADVAVIGAGGSGLAAAITAASLGRKVVLVEKEHAPGGTTGRSVGAVTMANTRHQLRKGILDSRSAYFDDFGALSEQAGAPDNLTLRRLLVENASETLRWLEDMGIVFHGPMPEVPHRQPRMHAALPNSSAYIFHLVRRARKLGVTILPSTKATSFIVEGGRVRGVNCEGGNGAMDVRSTAVVLASGDYSASESLKRQYISEPIAGVTPVSPSSTGDGHRMAAKLGARVLNGKLHHAGIRFIPPPHHWTAKLPPYSGLMRIVDFCLETLPGWALRPFVMSFITSVIVPSLKLFGEGALLIGRTGEKCPEPPSGFAAWLAQQPDQLAYILLDGRLAEKFSKWPYYVSTVPGFVYAFTADYRRSRKDIFHEAGSLAELGRLLRIPGGGLEETVADHNAALAHEGKEAQRIDRPPFIALGPVRYYINFTDGGLAVDDRLRVLGHGDVPVPGLYAAGSTGQGGLLLEGHGHHLSWAFTSGRLAGTFAAEETVSADIEPAKAL